MENSSLGLLCVCVCGDSPNDALWDLDGVHWDELL